MYRGYLETKYGIIEITADDNYLMELKIIDNHDRIKSMKIK